MLPGCWLMQGCVLLHEDPALRDSKNSGVAHGNPLSSSWKPGAKNQSKLCPPKKWCHRCPARWLPLALLPCPRSSMGPFRFASGFPRGRPWTPCCSTAWCVWACSYPPCWFPCCSTRSIGQHLTICLTTENCKASTIRMSFEIWDVKVWCLVKMTKPMLSFRMLSSHFLAPWAVFSSFLPRSLVSWPFLELVWPRRRLYGPSVDELGTGNELAWLS